MPEVRPIQTNFTSGELSPRMHGRTDLEQYQNGAAELLNMVVLTQGGATKRQGSYFIGRVKDNTARVRLVPFKVSVQASYVMEFGNLYIRFYRNRAQLLAEDGTALELVTPYTTADLRSLKFTQSADVLYITHANATLAPMKLSRTTASTFTLQTIAFVNGPYQPDNTGDVGASGSYVTTDAETATTAPAATATGWDLGNGVGGGESGGASGGGSETSSESGGGPSGPDNSAGSGEGPP